jgi:hypothetical protein
LVTVGSITFEENFAALTRFQQREGHCVVPQRHKEGDLALGKWVSGQRKNKDDLSPERRELLEALGFVCDVFAAAWEAGFVAGQEDALDDWARVFDGI